MLSNTSNSLVVSVELLFRRMTVIFSAEAMTGWYQALSAAAKTKTRKVIRRPTEARIGAPQCGGYPSAARMLYCGDEKPSDSGSIPYSNVPDNVGDAGA